ncbi:hypothetical protein Aph02nite_08410 [Actinoplanes philippinensis]|uniref:Uncharacterized protein n=1 Tax=Actinoplanes philippinensis TaxID=35752 RepID=A0A1I2AGH7_9ACTN|nr:hypothetical protein [Actinoplanes philippinensis]GIE74891.1 hypothetical protein Aph02nite_08410 [Actinoplanes philippinensis]SFE42992.1 hypothetical protein SAMN05421541_101698 [Actinoplanes philippinensis]
MTPRPCTDGTLRHLSVDLDFGPGEDGGLTGYALCSTPERRVWTEDQSAIWIGYDMGLRKDDTNIDRLPPCAECLRVAELLADPETAPHVQLQLRPPRPTTAAEFDGDGIRNVLITDVFTGALPGRAAAVYLLIFTAVPDRPGFGELVEIMDLPWDMGAIVRMGQVGDWAAVVGFAASADVPERDRRLIALAARLAGEEPVGPEAAAEFAGDPEAAQRVTDALDAATGRREYRKINWRRP